MVLPIFGQLTFDGEKQGRAMKDLLALLQVLDNQLKMSSFLVGKTQTLADITVASALVNVFQFALQEKARNNFNNVMKWFKTVTSQKEWVNVWGKSRLCVKEMPPVLAV